MVVGLASLHRNHWWGSGGDISTVTYLDREQTLLEVKRLALILWRVHQRQRISSEDKQSVYNILFGRTVLIGRHIAPQAIFQVIYEVTDDFEFTINTVKQLLPAVLFQQPTSVLQ